MTVVFSFCDSDAKMAWELARHIEAMGGVRNHACLLLSPEGTNTHSWEIESCLKKSFGQFTALQYRETLKGWPDGPNQCFSVAARQMCGAGEPWLWMEPDCVPMRPEWLDEIESEYRYCGKPVLGVTEDTYGPDGKVSGRHVNGVAVYPGNWWTVCPVLSTLESATDSYRRSGNAPPAFDCYISGYAAPRCAESKTIQNLWKSYGFLDENGVVKCRFKQQYGASNVVRPDAAMVHGCKDFTLLSIAQHRLLV